MNYNWKAVGLHYAVMLSIFILSLGLLGDFIGALFVSWIIVGRAALIKTKKVIAPYSTSVRHQLAIFSMAVIWPYYSE